MRVAHLSIEFAKITLGIAFIDISIRNTIPISRNESLTTNAVLPSDQVFPLPSGSQTCPCDVAYARASE